MSLNEQIAGFENAYTRGHAKLLERVDRSIADPTAFGGVGVQLAYAIVVAPGKTARECDAIAPTIEDLIAHNHDDLHYVDVANALECCGVGISATTRTTMPMIVAKVRASRDDADASTYWSKGFAALALDDKKICSKYLNSSLPFEPGATYEFNLQTFITMLANAIAHHALAESIVPAYEAVLANYPIFKSASTLEITSLFWIARVVHHRIGGAPLGDVAKLLHDTLWRLAGL